MKVEEKKGKCPKCDNGLDRKGVQTDSHGQREYVFCSECGHTKFLW